MYCYRIYSSCAHELVQVYRDVINPRLGHEKEKVKRARERVLDLVWGPFLFRLVSFFVPQSLLSSGHVVYTGS